MGDERLLIPFAFSLIAVLLATILVPYILRRSDLLTAWNFFLLGSINFVGLASLKAAYESDTFRILAYERRDYELYIIGAITFFVALFGAYYLIKFPRKMAGRLFRKWPPVSMPVLYTMIALAMGSVVIAYLPFYISGVSQAISQLSNKGIIVAVALAFVAWFKERSNPVLLGILIGIFLLSAVLSIMAGGGRRSLLSVGVTIPICIYWTWVRYKSPWYNLVFFGTTAIVGILLLAAYTSIRHFDRRGEMKERSIANAFDALKELPTLMFSSDVEGLAGQNATQTSLAAIHLYTNELPPKPFHSVIFVSTIAIPREFWEGKPMGLGYMLPKDARARGTRATWGPGIVGHGFHEGGLHMLIFYGLLAGCALRFLDEQLVRQPDNPYLLAMLSAMSGHLIGWTRGDIATFSIQIITCFLAVHLFSIFGRIAFGTGMTYPRTDDAYFVNQNMFQATLTQTAR